MLKNGHARHSWHWSARASTTSTTEVSEHSRFKLKPLFKVQAISVQACTFSNTRGCVVSPSDAWKLAPFLRLFRTQSYRHVGLLVFLLASNFQATLVALSDAKLVSFPSRKNNINNLLKNRRLFFRCWLWSPERRRSFFFSNRVKTLYSIYTGIFIDGAVGSVEST